MFILWAVATLHRASCDVAVDQRRELRDDGVASDADRRARAAVVAEQHLDQPHPAIINRIINLDY